MSKSLLATMLLFFLGCTGCMRTQHLRYPEKSLEIQQDLQNVEEATVYLRDGTKVVNTPIEMKLPTSIIVHDAGYPRLITMDAVEKIRYNEKGDMLFGAALGANPGLMVAVAALSALGVTLGGVFLAVVGTGLLITGGVTGALIGSQIETKTLIVYEAPVLPDPRRLRQEALIQEVRGLHKGDRIQIALVKGTVAIHEFAYFNPGADHFVVDPGVFSWKPIRLDEVQSISVLPAIKPVEPAP